MADGTPNAGGNGDLVLVKDAAAQTGVSSARIYRWIAAGQLTAMPSSHGKRVALSELQALLRNVVSPPDEHDDAYLPAFRAARLANVSPARVRYWVKRGLLPAQQGPHGMLVRPADVRACAAKVGTGSQASAGTPEPQ